MKSKRVVWGFRNGISKLNMITSDQPVNRNISERWISRIFHYRLLHSFIILRLFFPLEENGTSSKTLKAKRTSYTHTVVGGDSASSVLYLKAGSQSILQASSGRLLRAESCSTWFFWRLWLHAEFTNDTKQGVRVNNLDGRVRTIQRRTKWWTNNLKFNRLQPKPPKVGV